MVALPSPLLDAFLPSPVTRVEGVSRHPTPEAGNRVFRCPLLRPQGIDRKAQGDNAVYGYVLASNRERG